MLCKRNHVGFRFTLFLLAAFMVGNDTVI